MIRFIFRRWTAVLIPCVMGFSGCESIIQPTNAAREQSFRNVASHVTPRSSDAFRSTYFIYASDEEFHPTVVPLKGTFGISVNDVAIAGLAVAVSRDGYLLSAAHVIRKYLYVLGYMDGRVDIAQARVVRAQNFKEFG